MAGVLFGELSGLFPSVGPQLRPHVPLLVVSALDVGPSADRAHRLVAARHAPRARGCVANRAGLRTAFRRLYLAASEVRERPAFKAWMRQVLVPRLGYRACLQ